MGQDKKPGNVPHNCKGIKEWENQNVSSAIFNNPLHNIKKLSTKKSLKERPNFYLGISYRQRTETY